jgi:hypothetical protein
MMAPCCGNFEILGAIYAFSGKWGSRRFNLFQISISGDTAAVQRGVPDEKLL